MKKLVPFLICILLLTACTAKRPTQEATPVPAYRQITMNEAIAMMEKESDYIILDVRTAEEFSEGHIPGAINIANEVIGTDEIPQLPDKEQLILVYCRSGNRSKQASQKLAALGYVNVVEFGGIIDWPGATE